MIELRKVLIEVMYMHVATLCPILLMWLFIRERIELSPESHEEVLDKARLADLGVPKNQNSLMLLHAYIFIIILCQLRNTSGRIYKV